MVISVGMLTELSTGTHWRYCSFVTSKPKRQPITHPALHLYSQGDMELACFMISEGEHNDARAILYISDRATCSDPVSAALRGAGYEVVSTKSAMQAIALYSYCILLLLSSSIAGRENRPAVRWREACERFGQMFRSSCCAVTRATDCRHA